MKPKPMDRALRRALSQAAERPGSQCPDDNSIAVYLEAGLSAEERSRLEEHAAICESCQQVLALAMSVSGENEEVRVLSRAGKRRFRFWRLVPAYSLAVVVVALAAGVLLVRFTQKPAVREPATEIAAVRTGSESGRHPGERPASDEAPELRAERFTNPQKPVPPPAAASRSRGTAGTKPQSPVAPEMPPHTANATDSRRTPPDRDSRLDKAEEPKPDRVAGGLVGGVIGGIVQGSAPAAVSAPKPAEAETRESSVEPVRKSSGDAAFRSALSAREAVQLMAGAEGKSGTDHVNLGGKAFFRVSDWWVDGTANPGSAFVELPAATPEGREILNEIPGLSRLLAGGARVIVFYNNRNNVLLP